MKPLRLNFRFQNYAWGNAGKNTIFHQFGLLNSGSLETPIAEGWIGAHPLLSSTIDKSGEELVKLLEREAVEVLGEKVLAKFGKKLPFLFKILSVAKPLSIQVHPDREKAALLHSQFPDRYPENNHKPELAVALTEVELLCGFRKADEIRASIAELGPLRNLVGELPEGMSDIEFLKFIFEKTLLASDERRLDASDSLKELLARDTSKISKIFLRLQDLYPGDPGVFQCFLLNILTLSPGDSLFVPPNTPHAYLSGELIECMAASDFVIRAGLTPKLKDISALLSVVDYKSFDGQAGVCRAEQSKSYLRYPAEAEEFCLEKLSGSIVGQQPAKDSPTLYFVLSGIGSLRIEDENYQLNQSDAILIPATTTSHDLEFEGELFRVTIP